jgi:hypothetical protein
MPDTITLLFGPRPILTIGYRIGPYKVDAMQPASSCKMQTTKVFGRTVKALITYNSERDLSQQHGCGRVSLGTTPSPR